MAPEISISVIILNYNGQAFIKECLDSVFKSEFRDYEVIFVDNGSVDGSVGFAESNYPRARIIKNKNNAGFAAVNNNAVRLARGKYLFFLNNDTKIHPRALTALYGAMENDSSIGICGCTIMDYEGKDIFHSGIGVDIFGFPVAGGTAFYAEGSALMIQTEFFKLLEGFDERYFMFHEDIDLAWRCRLFGRQVIAVPEAVVYHYAGASAGGGMTQGVYRSSLFRRYLSERNNIRTLFKNYGFLSLAVILPGYVLINFFEFFFFLLVGQPRTAFCYPRAYWWNIAHFLDTVRYRKKVQRQRVVSDRDIIHSMHKISGKLLGFRKVKVPVFG